MTNPLKNGGSSKLQIILWLITIVAMGVAAWTSFSMKDYIRERDDAVTAAYQSADREMKEETNKKFDEIKNTLQRIEDKLDRKADKPGR